MDCKSIYSNFCQVLQSHPAIIDPEGQHIPLCFKLRLTKLGDVLTLDSVLGKVGKAGLEA